jgi:hypothetical protein
VNNRLIYAAAAGIAVAAVAVFFLLAGGGGGGRGIGIPALGPSGSTGAGGEGGGQGQQQQQQGQAQVLPPVIALKEIKVTPPAAGSGGSGGNASPSMTVAFTVKNPNSATLVLESIHYDVYVDKERVAVGDWGGTSEGFVAGSDKLTVIVSGTSVTIKDPSPTIIKNSGNAEARDRMLAGNASFTVSGTYAYRLTAALNTVAEEKDFSLTYP